jgi:hypothetical protein
MKAVRYDQFGGPEVLEIVDLPDPHPGPGQVRIAVRAAGVTAPPGAAPVRVPFAGSPGPGSRISCASTEAE